MARMIWTFEACAAARDAPCGRAHVRAVKVEADALPQLLDHALGQANVSARGADRGAVVALLDAAQKPVRGVALNVGMGRNHLLDVHECLHAGQRAMCSLGS